MLKMGGFFLNIISQVFRFNYICIMSLMICCDVNSLFNFLAFNAFYLQEGEASLKVPSGRLNDVLKRKRKKTKSDAQMF